MEKDLVYFDWNIIGYYRDYKFKGDTRLKSNFQFLEKLINEKRIISFYTMAHIKDLIPIDKSKANAKDYDFKSISFFTNNALLLYDYVSNKFSFLEILPDIVYSQELQRESSFLDLDGIFEEMEEIGVHLKEMLQKIPSPVKQNEYFSSSKNLYDIMNELVLDNNKSIKDSKFFKHKRKIIFEADQSGELMRMHKEIKLGDYSTYRKLLEQYFEAISNSIKNHFDVIMSSMRLLDSVRIGSDKAQRNLELDSEHATYSAVAGCKFLVTEDKKFLQKVGIVYDVLGFPVKPVNFEEFLSYYYS